MRGGHNGGTVIDPELDVGGYIMAYQRCSAEALASTNTRPRYSAHTTDCHNS